MDWSDIASWAVQAVTALGGGVVVAVLLIRWGADRLATRLEMSWEQESNRQIEVLRNELATNRDLVHAALSTTSAAYLQAQERRIEAVAALWHAVLEIRSEDYTSVVGVVDMIPESYIEKRRLADLFPVRNVVEAGKLVARHMSKKGEVEEHRPFLNHRIWTLFRVYRALDARVFVDLVRSFEKDDRLMSIPTIMRRDGDSPRSLLETVLTEEELEKVSRRSIGQHQVTKDLLERKILLAISDHLTGVEGSRMGLDEALRTMEQLDQAEAALRLSAG